eukprot:scaffold6112_cov116-Cylindrotheca_fusiformis.AAC.3
MVHSECAQACRDSVCMLDLNKLESIPSKVTVIGNGAFQKCTLLQRLVLREGLERIGVGSFSGCGDLTTVGGPSTVTKIDHGAFQRCSGLERLGLNEGLERIGECSFSECESLTAVDIPSTVAKIEKVRSNIARACTGSGCEMGLKKLIGNAAFRLCGRLERVGLTEGLERIGEFAFQECKYLIKVDVPATVKAIGDCAFQSCRCLYKVGLTEGLERIGKFAFSGCGCLSVVVISATVKVVDNYVFEWCRGLERVGLQEGLEEIGECAFSGCDSLTGVVIPSTVSAKGDNAFMRDCSISERSSQASRQ